MAHTPGTLLFDLDDTLLVNSVDRFLPSYIKAIGKHLAAYASPEKVIQSLLEGTRQMTENFDPTRPLRRCFDDHFFPALRADREAMQTDIDRFYRDVFPSLQSLTQPNPQGRPVIERALQAGWRVVIATNPLFPETAVFQRLGWAGLPVNEIPFTLVSTYEHFHFTKPHPEYFAEVLAQLGWPEGPVVVIGDDTVMDIAPCAQLGLPAVWIPTKEPAVLPEDCKQSAMAVNLDEGWRWINEQPPDMLVPRLDTPATCLAILRANPAALASISEPVDQGAWNRRTKAGQWSLAEIACHLRDVEQEVNLPRTLKILDETNPFLPALDTDRWAEERDYAHQDGQLALADYVAARLQLLSRLAHLVPEDWRRPARHSIFGRTNLAELVRIAATHERLHVRQFYQEAQAEE
jgi:HAD superfamily hydrolase (TIGR01549 family)